MIQTDNLVFSTMERFLKKKISAAPDNLSYRTGSLDADPIAVSSPDEIDISWYSVVYVKSTHQIWTNGEIGYGSNTCINAFLDFTELFMYIKCPKGSLLSTDVIQVGRYYSRRVKYVNLLGNKNYCRKKSWAIPPTFYSLSVGEYITDKYFVVGSPAFPQTAYNAIPSTFKTKECYDTTHNFINSRLGLRVLRNGIPITHWMPFTIRYNYDSAEDKEADKKTLHFSRWNWYA